MHDLSLYALELLENSVRAGATQVRTRVTVDRDRDRLAIAIEDDGPGLPGDAGRAANPFFTTKPGKRTGLGLSLFAEAVEAAGGSLRLTRSEDLGGAGAFAEMGLSHVDRPPLGDLVSTVAVMAATNPGVSFTLEVVGGGERCALAAADLTRRSPETERLTALLQACDATTPTPDSESAVEENRRSVG